MNTSETYNLIEIYRRCERDGLLEVYLEFTKTDEVLKDPRWSQSTFFSDGTIRRQSDSIRRIIESARKDKRESVFSNRDLCMAVANDMEPELEQLLSKVALKLEVELECHYYRLDRALYVVFSDNKERINSLTLSDIETLFK